MRMTQRARRAGIAAGPALVVVVVGVAVGAAALAPAVSAPAPAVAVAASYADVVRQVLPSVVLIRTADGLGSGVVLDRSSNIVPNAHVTPGSTSPSRSRA